MEIITHTIPYESRGDVFTFYGIGDIHAGVKSCDEALLDRVIAEVKANPLARWFGLGDYGDYINFRDPRFDIAQLAPWLFKRLSGAPMSAAEKRQAGFTIASAQRDWLVAKLQPIAQQCMGLTIGNHEDTIRRHYDDQTGYTLSAQLKVPYLGFCSYNQICFVPTQPTPPHVDALVVYIHHGYFAGRLAGGIALNLERLFLANPQADVVWVGHAHKRMAFPVDAWDIQWRAKKPMQHRTRFAIMSGPFKRAYSLPGELPTWEETRGFPPSSFGPIRFTFRPRPRTLEVIQ